MVHSETGDEDLGSAKAEVLVMGVTPLDANKARRVFTDSAETSVPPRAGTAYLIASTSQARSAVVSGTAGQPLIFAISAQ